MSKVAKPEQQTTGRAGKTMAGAYLVKTDLYTIQELCLRLSRERGHRMHFQEFAVAAFTHECARYGVKLSGKSN